jgi:phosphoribosylglycinamide formyltransferase 1
MVTRTGNYKIGWFSTGRGPGSRGLLTAAHNAIASGEIKAEIEFVFCSREPGDAEGSDQFLRLVQEYQLPLVALSYQSFRKAKGACPPQAGDIPAWRLDYDREIMARLKPFKPDLSILAGYMLVIGPEMCRRYKMLNLHPAAPGGPKGTWQEVIWQLIAEMAQSTGVMMHLVTPELDRGPVVTYCTFPIRGGAFEPLWQQLDSHPIDEAKKTEGEENALFKLIRAEGVKREIPLILTTIKAFSEGRVEIEDGRVFDASGCEVKGYDLTQEIEAKIAGR